MSNKWYDIPSKLKRECKRGSPALQEFYRHFFVNETGLIRGEVDLTFLKDLVPPETKIAKDLIRRNLARRYTHSIEGAAALQDEEAIPHLRRLLANESDLSRQLTISGALWRLTKDASFPACLRRLVESDSASLKVAHIDQVAWLADERAIEILIQLATDDDNFVRYLALSRLNEIEHKEAKFAGAVQRHSSDYYVSRRGDESFVRLLARNLTELLH